ncbi:MAG TPA: DUF2786 domain-containing protein [Gemmatimonadales bacterium]|nr:DUF2786 domain-containing protein [Gemmatimonadales bacterium]
MPAVADHKILNRLKAVDVLAREGATQGERDAAKARAAEMRQRYGLAESPAPRRQTSASWSTPPWYDAFNALFRTPRPTPRPDPAVHLRCTCGHVTKRVLLDPRTLILAYRCDGCQRQRRQLAGEFEIV